MCTVSFVCTNNKIIITSNRDEQVLRPSIEPKNYLINNKNIFFPKDPKAGGTWFAVTDNATVLVLLNGASEKHKWQPPYRKSRGLILLDIISNQSPIAFWKEINLVGIEPFTLVLYQNQNLYQLRWNGLDRETVLLDTNKNYVWSSSTLYPKDIREKRAEWFYEFLETKPTISEKEMFNFHRYTENENLENGLIINRNDNLKTLSITQTVLEDNKVSMMHYDLTRHSEFENSFIIV